MKKNKIAAAYKNNLKYKKCKTYTIAGVVITGEEVNTAMNTNVFVGEHIIAMTKDGSFFKEEIARSIYLYDRRPELVGGYGLGELGNNTVFELFDHNLTVEEKVEFINYMSK